MKDDDSRDYSKEGAIKKTQSEFINMAENNVNELHEQSIVTSGARANIMLSYDGKDLNLVSVERIYKLNIFLLSFEGDTAASMCSSEMSCH